MNHFNFDPQSFKALWRRHRKPIVLLGTIAVVVLALIVLFTGASQPAYAQATPTPTNTPTTAPTNTLTPTPIATGIANASANGLLQYLICGEYSFGRVTPGACVQIYNGSDIEVKSSTGARTWFLDGETGNVTASGSIAQGSTGTKCVSGTQSITGSGTVVPGTLSGAGISTPSAVIASLASDSTGDLHHVSTTKGSGVVTLKVWNSALTPVAASGAATIDFLVCGQ